MVSLEAKRKRLLNTYVQAVRTVEKANLMSKVVANSLMVQYRKRYAELEN